MRDAQGSCTARRNRGWLFILDENFSIIARPSAAFSPVLDDAERLVAQAVAAWYNAGARTESLILLTTVLVARVFSLQGPGGSCILVCLEHMLVRPSS